MSGITHAFDYREVETKDGTALFEVVTAYGESVAHCSDEDAADELSMDLNMILTAWLDKNPTDRMVAT